MEHNLIMVGTRSIQKTGNSLTIPIPRRELREELGAEEEDLVGQNVVVALNDQGELSVDLGRVGAVGD